MIAKHVLSYTGRAQPLTAEDVRRDLAEFDLGYRLGGRHRPDEILVWEHQWDFLVKKNVPTVPQPEFIFEKVEFGADGLLHGFGRRLPKIIGAGTLWGVPVEVLEA